MKILAWLRGVDLWNFTNTFSCIHVMLVKRSYFVWIWKKIGPVFFALALGSSTYFPTILELRELKTDVSNWKTNTGPNVVSLSIFGSNHQPGDANNNKDLITLVRTLPTNILFTILFVDGGVEGVEWVGEGGLWQTFPLKTQHGLFHNIVYFISYFMVMLIVFWLPETYF